MEPKHHLTREESIEALVAAAPPPIPEESRRIIADILGPVTVELRRRRAAQASAAGLASAGVRNASAG